MADPGALDLAERRLLERGADVPQSAHHCTHLWVAIQEGIVMTFWGEVGRTTWLRCPRCGAERIEEADPSNGA